MKYFTILLFLLPVSATAQAEFNYTADNRTITIVEYTGNDGMVIIPDTIVGFPVVRIGRNAFRKKIGMIGVFVPETVTSIEEHAFSGCTSLTSVTIPRGVNDVGSGAFHDCNSLTAITVDPLNSTYSSLDGVLFNKGRDLLIKYPAGKAGGYRVPGSVTHIEVRAFRGCTGLTSVTMPSSVTSIGRGAFEGCTSLTSVTISNGVFTIGNSAFADCTRLSSIIVPESVTSLGDRTFAECSSLTVIEVDTLNPAYSSLDDVLFNKTQQTLIQYPCGKTGSYRIPDGVTGIKFEAFRGCTSLTNVTIPDSVVSIGDQAFFGCTNLVSVSIPGSVTQIAYAMFAYCTNLGNVYFDGDAPVLVGRRVFAFSPAAIVYFRSGATGWNETFDDRPTALWIDPPIFGRWIGTTDLPPDSAETDDPDQDNMDNYAEMLAGTNPTDAASLLIFDPEPRLEDLRDEDKTPIVPDQHILYVRSVPGKTYGVQWADTSAGPWNVDKVVTATTTQTRFVFDRPASRRFYRVFLAQ